MMSCWIVAGYMAYSGIDYMYNTISYTEWMNLTSRGGGNLDIQSIGITSDFGVIDRW